MRNAKIEEQWMLDFQRGSEEGFNHLVNTYQNRLYQFFLQVGETHCDASEMVQETLLRLYQARHKYRAQGTFRAWIFTLARHARIDYHRRRKGRRAEESAPLADSGYTLEPRADWEEVNHSLDQLSEKLRMVLVLKVYYELTYDEIAEILTIPSGTVKSRLHLALGKMRKILAADWSSSV